jgi:hypothetical protein
MTTFYCLRFESPPSWRARSPYLYPAETGRAGCTPRHWVRFPSPRTIRRATVEVFDPASTRESSTVFYCVLLLHSISVATETPVDQLYPVTPYPWTRLVITQRQAGFRESVSMETCFADSFSSNGSTCHIISKNITNEKN